MAVVVNLDGYFVDYSDKTALATTIAKAGCHAAALCVSVSLLSALKTAGSAHFNGFLKDAAMPDFVHHYCTQVYLTSAEIFARQDGKIIEAGALLAALTDNAKKTEPYIAILVEAVGEQAINAAVLEELKRIEEMTLAPLMAEPVVLSGRAGVGKPPQL